jgi:hypothetical protein|tara:strand:- start:4257 stop:4529 length:273 start_codon:yes stop_codon:yes gene_type:complete
MDNGKKIKELRAEADRLEELDKKNSESPKEYRLAEMIHSKMCHWNHIDGCGWHYESWDNIGDSRQRYIDKANFILAQVQFEYAYKSISLM